MVDNPPSVIETLISLAIIAQGNSYSPHSNYPVGAAVLAINQREGKLQIFTGTNIENDSYGLTICAERVAMFTAVAAGYTDLLYLVCVTDDGIGTSCGSCRQVAYQFSPSMETFFCNALGEIISKFNIFQLLPEAFTLNEER